MICELFSWVPIPGYSLSCQSTGAAVWLAQAAALAVVAVSGAWALVAARGPLHRTGGGLVALAALCLGFAAGLPIAVPDGPAPEGGRVAVVLDLSESLRRGGDAGFEAARAVLADRVEGRVAGQATETQAAWEGRLFGFSGGRRAMGVAVPLARLATLARSTPPGAPGSDSDLAGGLSEALEWISEGPGSGELFLLTDGWFTRADPAAEIARAAGRGIPLHVLAYGAESVSEGLVGWDLGPEQVVLRPAVARLVTRGPGELTWSIDGLDGAPVALAGGDAAQPVRLPVIFPARGFSHLAVAHRLEDTTTRQVIEFTLVRGPARLLVYGPGGWASGLPPELYSVSRAAPGDPQELSDYDVVAIDGLEPGAFPAGFTDAVLSAATGGTGLLLINGPQRGAVTEPQRMADWEATALGPILPVNSDPDYVILDPPPRVVLVIIDTSGSMNGDNAVRARQAAHRILDFIRPQDRVTILPFSSGVGSTFDSATMPPEAVARARRYIDGLLIGGGTNMESAIEAAGRLRGTDCDLFVIGDGGYEAGQVNTSPICKTTAIGVAGIELPGFDTRWGQQVVLRPGQQLAAVNFETFEPEPRLEFWRAGPLDLRSVAAGGPFAAGGRAGGLALAYARPESEVVVIPGEVPPDPALVFRDDPVLPSLRTGVFMGDMTSALLDPALLATLTRLTGWSEPDRFDIDLRMRGGRLLAGLATAEGWPVPAQVSLSLRHADGRVVPFAMQNADQPGTFQGSAMVQLGAEVETVSLVLRTGEGRAQLIPMRLPARERQGAVGAAREKDSVGVNRSLLAEMTRATGGVDLSVATPRGADRTARQQSIGLWPLLAALSTGFLSLGLWCGGARK